MVPAVRLPLSTPMNRPGFGESMKPSPSMGFAELPPLGSTTLRLPAPRTHHVAETAPPSSGFGANQAGVPLAVEHWRTEYGPSFWQLASASVNAASAAITATQHRMPGILEVLRMAPSEKKPPGPSWGTRRLTLQER